MTLHMPSQNTVDVMFNFCSISIYVYVLWQFRDEVGAHHYIPITCLSYETLLGDILYPTMMFLSRSSLGKTPTRTPICIALSGSFSNAHRKASKTAIFSCFHAVVTRKVDAVIERELVELALLYHSATAASVRYPYQ